MITLPLTILLAEDDLGHAALVQRNLRRAAIANDMIHVRNGQALLDYLRGAGTYTGRAVPEAPLILLDINMPGLDGVETLTKLKADADTQAIPVIMLSTADNPREIAAIRQLGLFLQFVRVPTHHDGG
jgi:CheY-like chemotaxis protein